MLGRRLARLALVGAKHGTAHLLRGRRGPRGPQRLRRFLEELGGTFLKFGQVLSLQPDLLSREVCDALFDLLDRVPPFEVTEVERTFREDLGSGPDEIFESFSSTPVASASIGQVHVARRDGRAVAVKVRRPGIEQVFAADLRLMEAVARVIEVLRLERLYWLVRAVREFATWTAEELDYRFEAEFMRALAHHAESSPHEAVPGVVEDLSTARILVAELLEGPTVLDYIRSLDAGDESMEETLRAQGFDPETFARHIVENFVSDAFHHGLFHADLHPANLLVLPDNVVGYVDFGITGSLSPYARRHLVALTLALSRADTDAMVTAYLRIATTEAAADLPGFRRELRRLIGEWYETVGSGRRMRVSFTRVMLDMLHLSRHTGIGPSQDVVRYIRSVITADGLIQRFAPGLEVRPHLERVCADFLRSETRRSVLSMENAADWALVGSELLRSGPATLSALLRRVEGEIVSTGEREGAAPEELTRRRQLLAVIAGLATVAVAVPSSGNGIDLPLVALVLAAAGVTMLVWTLVQ